HHTRDGRLSHDVAALIAQLKQTCIASLYQHTFGPVRRAPQFDDFAAEICSDVSRIVRWLRCPSVFVRDSPILAGVASSVRPCRVVSIWSTFRACHFVRFPGGRQSTLPRAKPRGKRTARFFCIGSITAMVLSALVGATL